MSEQLDALWMARAACKGQDTEAWYVDAPHTDAGDFARSFCDVCPVRSECLEYALVNHEPEGIWGGKTWRQRRRIRQRRQQEAINGPAPERKRITLRGEGGKFLGTKVVEVTSEGS